MDEENINEAEIQTEIHTKIQVMRKNSALSWRIVG